MKNIFAAFLLIGCVSLFYTTVEAAYARAYLTKHGYDGLLRIDHKTGLFIPPLKYPDPDAADELTLEGPYANYYCKLLTSGNVFNKRYYTNYCQKEENGKKIDLCCTGYKCTDYGFPKGVRGYCQRKPRK